MEDIIYILIGIAWIGFTLYNSQRKLKQKQEKARQAQQESGDQTSAYEERSKSKSFIDSLLEEFEEKTSLSGEKTYETKTPAPEKQDSFEETVRKRREADYHSIKSVEEYESIENVVEDNSQLSSNYFNRHKETKDKKQKADKVKDERKSGLAYDESFYDEEVLDFEFDLKQAVIYSEILNKPKYLESFGT